MPSPPIHLASVHSQPNCQLDRCSHARRIGLTRARDVQSGPVVRRSPRKRQAQRDIYRTTEGRHLDRGHSYIMIRREDRVELAPHGPNEDGIRRKRAGGS
jgi:hypothetical protein